MSGQAGRLALQPGRVAPCLVVRQHDRDKARVAGQGGHHLVDGNGTRVHGCLDHGELYYTLFPQVVKNVCHAVVLQVGCHHMRLHRTVGVVAPEVLHGSVDHQVVSFGPPRGEDDVLIGATDQPRYMVSGLIH